MKRIFATLTILALALAAGCHAQSALPAATAFQVNLTWQAPASSPDPVAGYDVLRAPSGSTSYLVLNAALIALSAYTDPSVSAGQTYDYIVESVDAKGVTSTPSNMAAASVPALPAAATLGNLKML